MNFSTPRLRSLDAAFLDRVRRSYRSALADGSGSPGRLWRIIRGRQASVHAALLADTDDDLRAIFADPLSCDLYYGVDNLCRSMLGETFADAATIKGFSEDSQAVLFGLARTLGLGAAGDWRGFDFETFLDRLDPLLNQRVEFPTLFSGELGLATSRGVAGYRAIQALYQTWRVLGLLSSAAEKSIVEIGPGMGRTAYYAFRAGITDYTTIDLPLGVVAQACFLGAALGPDKVWLPADDAGCAPGRIKLLFAGRDPQRRFGAALNADSLTEMPLGAALGYLAWIKRHASVFLSINHLQNLFSVAEIAALADLPLCESRPYPIRDGYVEEIFGTGDSTSSTDGVSAFGRHNRLRLRVLCRAAAKARDKLARTGAAWLAGGGN